MYAFSDMQKRQALYRLIVLHILVIAASNYLVQFPFQFLGVHSTWGAFTFPFIFLTTDLTVRIFGAPLARRIVLYVMFPSLLVSYAASVLFHDGQWSGFSGFGELDTIAARIAVASFTAYCVGQLLDIYVFNRLRQMKQWWIAPFASTILGNASDTIVFFTIAFWRSSNPFMATHWPEIGLVDYGFKILICTLFFLPAYGVLLKLLTERLTALQQNDNTPLYSYADAD